MIEAAEALEREAARSAGEPQRLTGGPEASVRLVAFAADPGDVAAARERAGARLDGLVLLHEARARLFRRCARSAEQMGAPWYVPGSVQR